MDAGLNLQNFAHQRVYIYIVKVSNFEIFFKSGSTSNKLKKQTNNILSICNEFFIAFILLTIECIESS